MTALLEADKSYSKTSRTKDDLKQAIRAMAEKATDRVKSLRKITPEEKQNIINQVVFILFYVWSCQSREFLEGRKADFNPVDVDQKLSEMKENLEKNQAILASCWTIPESSFSYSGPKLFRDVTQLRKQKKQIEILQKEVQKLENIAGWLLIEPMFLEICFKNPFKQNESLLKVFMRKRLNKRRGP